MVEPIRELKPKCQKPEREPGLSPLMRRISINVTWLLLHTPISANQVTLLFLLFGILGAVFFAVGDHLSIVIGTLCIEIHLVLDYVDGEIARYRGTTSWFGYYLELTCHMIVGPLLFFSISVGVYRHHISHLAIVVLGFVSALSWLMRRNNKHLEFWALFGGIKSGRRQYNNTQTIQSGNQLSTAHADVITIMKLMRKIFIDIEFSLIILPMMAILNRMDIMLYFYGVANPLSFCCAPGLVQWTRDCVRLVSVWNIQTQTNHQEIF